MNFLNINLMLQSDWITIVFLLIFLLLGLAKYFYKGRLFELSVLFFSKKYLLKYSKEVPLIINGFNALLFAIQILILSLLIIAFAALYRPELVIGSGFYLFLKTVTYVSLFFLIRYLIGLMLSLLFELKTAQQQISFVKMSYLFNTSILLLPLLLLFYFMKTHNSLLFRLLIAFFAILLVIRYVFVFKNNKSIVRRQWFNFLLYLCALEIAPLLLISKIII